MKKILFLTIIFQLLSSQDNSIPFQTYEISLGITKDLIDKDLSSYFDNENGFQLGIDFPFYLGHIRPNVIVASYKYLDTLKENRSFIYIHPNIEWSKPLTFLNNKLKWSNGLNIGSYIFYYKISWDKYFSIGKNTETELSLGFSTSVNYNFLNKFYFYISFKKDVVFTYKKININSFSIGFSRVSDSPKWLQGLLK